MNYQIYQKSRGKQQEEETLILEKSICSPFHHRHHLIIWLVSHHMINKIQMAARPVQEETTISEFSLSPCRNYVKIIETTTAKHNMSFYTHSWARRGSRKSGMWNPGRKSPVYPFLSTSVWVVSPYWKEENKKPGLQNRDDSSDICTAQFFCTN